MKFTVEERPSDSSFVERESIPNWVLAGGPPFQKEAMLWGHGLRHSAPSTALLGESTQFGMDSSLKRTYWNENVSI
jgi:hypothetical protein